MKRFGDEITGAALDRLDSVLNGSMASDNDADDIWIAFKGFIPNKTWNCWKKTRPTTPFAKGQ